MSFWRSESKQYAWVSFSVTLSNQNAQDMGWPAMAGSAVHRFSQHKNSNSNSTNLVHRQLRQSRNHGRLFQLRTYPSTYAQIHLYATVKCVICPSSITNRTTIVKLTHQRSQVYQAVREAMQYAPTPVHRTLQPSSSPYTPYACSAQHAINIHDRQAAARSGW